MPQPKYENIVILTGAGLSAESGRATFRDAGGVWAKYDYRDVATPEGFAKDPALVHAFYNQRRRDLDEVRPNAAHHALARLEKEHAGSLWIVTQNVDDLHEAAGSENLIHMHGELRSSLCANCQVRKPCRHDLSVELACEDCGKTGGVRPNVVWFGEIPYRLDDIERLLLDADLFVSIGTSGNVYPAAGFVREARHAGARCIELNLEATDGSSLFHRSLQGPATGLVPAFVDALVDRAGLDERTGR